VYCKAGAAKKDIEVHADICVVLSDIVGPYAIFLSKWTYNYI